MDSLVSSVNDSSSNTTSKFTTAATAAGETAMSNKLNQSTETEDDEDISMISPNDVLNDPKTPLRRRFINQTMTKAQNGQTISPVSQKFRNVKENDETGENTYANNNNNNNNLTNLQVSSTPLNFKKISKNSVNNNNIKNLDFENGTTINNDDEKIFNGSSIPNLTKYDYKSINLNNTYSNSNSNSQQNDNENNNEDLENSRILNVSEKAHFFFDKNQVSSPILNLSPRSPNLREKIKIANNISLNNLNSISPSTLRYKKLSIKNSINKNPKSNNWKLKNLSKSDIIVVDEENEEFNDFQNDSTFTQSNQLQQSQQQQQFQQPQQFQQQQQQPQQQNTEVNSYSTEIKIDSSKLSLHSLLTDPRVPIVLSLYLQLFFNIVIVSIIGYFIYSFVSTIQADVQNKIDNYAAEVLQEISLCAREYQRNHCDPGSRVPALEKSCMAWETCMERDPDSVGRAKIGAETFAEIINGFVKPISWKSVFTIFFLTVGSLVFTNVAFEAYRSFSSSSSDRLNINSKTDINNNNNSNNNGAALSSSINLGASTPMNSHMLNNSNFNESVPISTSPNRLANDSMMKMMMANNMSNNNINTGINNNNNFTPSKSPNRSTVRFQDQSQTIMNSPSNLSHHSFQSPFASPQSNRIYRDKY
ncbi:unnamed protein product [[Candida] boidinii]|uniref:Unnamed protein product n=1 Tax=Candida boidinii TaxID=5477 RepID=A0A9W6WGD2_CANBO|nr:unnamed protein product [[Candida] boidinii]